MAESEAKEEKRLTLKFAHQKGSLLPSVTTFLVRASTPFAKIFKAWREKENVGAGNAFRYHFDGKLVSPDDTFVRRPNARARARAPESARAAAALTRCR